MPSYDCDGPSVTCRRLRWFYSFDWEVCCQIPPLQDAVLIPSIATLGTKPIFEGNITHGAQARLLSRYRRLLMQLCYNHLLKLLFPGCLFVIFLQIFGIFIWHQTSRKALWVIPRYRFFALIFYLFALEASMGSKRGRWWRHSSCSSCPFRFIICVCLWHTFLGFCTALKELLETRCGECQEGCTPYPGPCNLSLPLSGKCRSVC